MHNTELVQVFNASNNLVKESASFRFLDSLILHNKIEKLSSACILHDQI